MTNVCLNRNHLNPLQQNRKLYGRVLRVAAIALLLCVVSSPGGQAQDGLPTHKRFTNQDVITMVQLGLSDDLVIAKIRAAAAKGADSVSFDTGPGGLKALKDASVSDAVISVMISPAPSAPVVLNASSPVTIDPNLPPPEVGVYWKDGSSFVLIQGQTLTNMKVGGKAGSMFTNGMRNMHWDAFIEGPKSKNTVRERRPTFYLYVPDGNDASDYVLIELNRKGNRREFQVGSFGGITGGKSGVKRDKEVPVTAEHVGIRTYRVTLNAELKHGEYAFFMGTGQTNTMSSRRSGGAASGRIYDFSIPE
jgi:hypothetical protein